MYLCVTCYVYCHQRKITNMTISNTQTLCCICKLCFGTLWPFVSWLVCTLYIFGVFVQHWLFLFTLPYSQAGSISLMTFSLQLLFLLLCVSAGPDYAVDHHPERSSDGSSGLSICLKHLITPPRFTNQVTSLPFSSHLWPSLIYQDLYWIMPGCVVFRLKLGLGFKTHVRNVIVGHLILI